LNTNGYGVENPLDTFRRYLRPYWRKVVVGMVCLAVGAIAGAATPWLLRLAINTFEQQAGLGLLFRYLLLMLAVALCAGVLRFLSRKLILYTSRNVEYDMRNDLFGHLLRMDMAFFSRWRTGDIMSRCTDDLGHVRLFIGMGLMLPADTLISVPTALTMMLLINPALTLVTMIPIPAISAMVYLLGGIVHVRSRQCQEQQAALADRARENLTGIRVVKSYVREEYETEQFEVECRKNLHRNFARVKVDSLFWPAISLLAGCSTILLLFFGGRAVISEKITLGDFAAFTFYTMMLYWPMAALGWVVNLYQRAKAAMIRLNEIFAEQPDIDDRHADSDFAWSNGDIEFRDVTVQYQGAGRPALQDINLNIRAGATTAIVGPTGSGKSSLVNLVPRLLDPKRGRVLVGGRNATEIPIAELRAHIGCVPQETFLFSDTLKENIAFGVAEPTIDQIAAAAGIAQLDGTVKELPNGLDTMLGERGVNLSGGQKQRATLARAIIVDPDVLILDDAMSSVDTSTEEAILDSIRTLRSGRTTLIISHRVSTVQHADTIVVLDDGRIVEQGTHAELIEQRGVYEEMYRLQQLERELEEA